MGPVAVDVAPVRTGRVELTRPLVASVEAAVRSTLAAEEGGLVAERLFDDGHAVKKGQVLVRVNTDLLKTQIAAAEAAVEALKAQIEQAQAELERAKLEVERMKPVIEQKAAPQKEMDNAVRDMRVTAAVLANRQAMLAEKQAELQRLKLIMEKSEVRAPFDGFVSKRYVEVGQWIKQGDVVADVVQLDPLYVRASVPEVLAPQLVAGQLVRVDIDAIGGQGIEGKVEQIMPEADAASRTVGVRVVVQNPDGKIRPGFFARATFFASSDERVWHVPKDAIVNRGPDTSVAVVRDGKAAIVPVRVIVAAGENVSISGDLVENESVIVRGNEQLRGGESLLIRGAPPPGSQPGM